ncbi:MAG: phosphatase PAP2 family protein [Ignavibacteriaceae bacterium]|nr:phosphatase PAP2 family protein [Ignavibacteriaceae bacterium]
MFLFTITVIGVTDGLSDNISKFLLNHLGNTNQWSDYYGPEWFVDFNREISALAGFPLLFIFITFIITYFHLRKESRRLWRLLFVFVGGGLLLFFTKLIFASEIPDQPLEFITNHISPFPSGHAMMGTIFYITLSVTTSRRQHSKKTKRLTIITGIIITLFIGISRILPGIHSFNDVTAGWSLGMIWLCICWLLERKIKEGLNKQNRLIA